MKGGVRGLLAAIVGAALAGVAGQTLRVIERADELIFDSQVRVLRPLRQAQDALPPRPDVVVVGIDEASLAAIDVPMAMMHAPLGQALRAIAAAGPRAIGLDIALPERSFDRLSPGLDRELMRGLLAARAAAGIALVLDLDAGGHPRVPDPPLLAAAGGAQAFGLALYPIDCDGVARRFDPDPAATAVEFGADCAAHLAYAHSQAPTQEGPEGSRAAATERVPAMPTFAALLARRLGRERELARPGWIDFTRGAAFSYIALTDVLAWSEHGDLGRLQRSFGGQIVLVGSVLPYLDRLQLPAALADWEFPGTPQPGVILTAQVLRNATGSGLLHPVPLPARLGLLLAMVAVAWCARPWMRWCLLAGTLGCGFAVATVLHAQGWILAPAQAMLAAITAVTTRTAFELAGARQERERLQRALGGYLSPRLLHALLAGRVDTDGSRRAVALLFADLRGFTSWSETADPELVRDTLNRYYAAITPLLHALGGTIDNLRGDGIMVMFGALGPQQQACDRALAGARQILEAVARLNRDELAPRGVAALEVSIGLAFGDVVVGDLGSAERKDYTALGDAVNVAARLQELAKTLGVCVLMTQTFAQRLASVDPGVRELGVHPLKGHSPVAVCSWMPLPQAAALAVPAACAS